MKGVETRKGALVANLCSFSVHLYVTEMRYDARYSTR